MCTHAHTHTHTEEYYLALRKKEILILVTSWMDLEGIMLRGRFQLEKDICCIVSLIYGTKTFFWTDIYTKQCVSCQGLRSARNKDRLIKKYTLLVVRGAKYEDLIFNMVTIIAIAVLYNCKYTRWWTCRSTQWWESSHYV